MADKENSVLSESIKDEHSNLPILHCDLISIPKLCGLFADQHGGMTYAESCLIIEQKFLKIPAFSIRLYKLTDYGLPFVINGFTLSLWFDIEESNEDEKEVKDAMRLFTRGIFQTRWWRHDDDYMPRIGELLITALDLGILKTEAWKFGVNPEGFDRLDQKSSIASHACEMPDLSKLSKTAVSKWPWGNHETGLLRHLAAAAEALWGLYDPQDPSTAPTNEQVETFLIGRGVPSSMAAKMATILRADGLPSGPRK